MTRQYDQFHDMEASLKNVTETWERYVKAPDAEQASARQEHDSACKEAERVLQNLEDMRAARALRTITAPTPAP